MSPRAAALAVVAVVAACAPQQQPQPPMPSNVGTVQPGSAGQPIPLEVTAFVDRWTNCWHFLGEEAPAGNTARAKEIQDGVARWCPGNEERLVALKAAYKDRPDVLAALAARDQLR